MRKSTTNVILSLRRGNPLLLIALFLGVAGAAWATPAAVNWLNRVAIGAGGSHVQGNPAARVRLTQYESYTCPHCAHFTAESGPALRSRFVAPGNVSVEVRHILRDPIDFAMTVAVNCGSSARFFSRHEAMMTAQSGIIARVQALAPATIERWGQVAGGQRLRRIADDSGVTAWMQGRGFTAAQINQCFADSAMHQRLLAMSNAASAAGINATPMFAINGQTQAVDSVYDWATLSTALSRAVGQ